MLSHCYLLYVFCSLLRSNYMFYAFCRLFYVYFLVLYVSLSILCGSVFLCTFVYCFSSYILLSLRCLIYRHSSNYALL